jgi:tight adherence protein C
MSLIQLTVTFLITTVSVVLTAWLLYRRNHRLESRLEGLKGPSAPTIGDTRLSVLARSALSKLGSPLLPNEEAQRTRLQTRLLHAGIYNPRALVTFLGIKMLLMFLPVIIGLLCLILHIGPRPHVLLWGLLGGLVGMFAPGLWVDYLKSRRQATLRRALPDFLDLVGTCLQAGLSLPAAFQRVATELRLAHPVLADELMIAGREIMLGCSTGDALRQFGDRCGLEEVRSLASVIHQAERFGAGIAKSLRVHAEALRAQRLMQAEEMAQKAAVRIVFPTLLFIFPAIFMVLAGPAVFQVLELLNNLE